MIQVFLLLCGSRAVRRKWGAILFWGLLWLFSGIFIFQDALDSQLRIAPIWFAAPLLLDGVWSVAQALSTTGAAKSLRLAKAGMILAVVSLIIVSPRHSGIIIGILVGTFLIADALCRGSFAYIIHFNGWRLSFFYAVAEGLSGIWSLIPWPTFWEGEVGADVGTLFIFSGIGICALALRIGLLPPDMSILTLMNRGWPAPATSPDSKEANSGSEEYEPEDVIIHIWTPTETLVPLRRGISRYFAASDANGVVSAGHAALELPPDVYISHYPAVEIDRDQAEFARTLRGTPDNDVPGLFQPGYREESAAWRPSTRQVRLPGLNGRAIRKFWKDYSADATYNLSTRSCAGAVAKALDAGMEGLFEMRVRSPLFVLRLLTTSELWVAGFLRHRAMAAAWTPGIMLDYARALAYILALPDGRKFDTRAAPPENHAHG